MPNSAFNHLRNSISRISIRRSQVPQLWIDTRSHQDLTSDRSYWPCVREKPVLLNLPTHTYSLLAQCVSFQRGDTIADNILSPHRTIDPHWFLRHWLVKMTLHWKQWSVSHFNKDVLPHTGPDKQCTVFDRTFYFFPINRFLIALLCTLCWLPSYLMLRVVLNNQWRSNQCGYIVLL